jgi:nucleoside-diphosphate-sugar epimerase
VKIFVTGGTGFVGSHLVEALMARDHEVVCLARSPAKVERVFGERRPMVVEGSLTDDEALRRGLSGADAVYHVAGLLAAAAREDFHRINAEATRHVVALAAEEAPNLERFVYVSSLAAAGPTAKGKPLRESAPARPVSAYGASKLAGEGVVRASHLPWTIVRPPAVYGPRDTELLRVFRMAKLGVVPVVGSAGQELSFVHVRELAGALVAVLDAAAATRNTYFATHPEIVTSGGFAEATYRAVRGGRRRPIVVPIPSGLARGVLTMTGAIAGMMGKATMLSADKANEFVAEAWTCVAEKLERDTGWTAVISLAEGARETAAWYRERGWI